MWTRDELESRDRVLERVRESIRSGQVIPLKPASSDYSGEVREYRFLFEGEEDLLHLKIERQDGRDLEVEEGDALAQFLLPGVPAAMIWKRPGSRSHHFYLGHDLLLTEE